ncbi:MAG: alpha/beta hydrolase [Sphingobium sp.]
MHFTLPLTQSMIVAGHVAGEDYRMDLAMPEGDAPASGWPSVVLLDAGGCFGTCVEALRRMSRRQDATGVRPAVIIGLSPAQDGLPSVQGRGAVSRRQRDFTSLPVDGRPVPDNAGGAGVFLDFIEQKVMPLAASRVPLDAGERTLFGHSLAGYFTLWALAHRPDLFRAYAAISPSIWWDRDGLLAALLQVKASDRRLFMAVGEWEEALPPWQAGRPGADDVLARRRSRRMIGNVRDFAQALRPVMGDNHVLASVMAQEDHASIISAAIAPMLRLASGMTGFEQ